MTAIIDYELSETPLYKKAKEIYWLSKHISDYFNQDLKELDLHGHEDRHIYFSGDLVRQSENLKLEVFCAEYEPFFENKEKHIQRLEILIYKLNGNCKRLEHSKSNGRNFIILLRKELQRFKALQKKWLLTL